MNSLDELYPSKESITKETPQQIIERIKRRHKLRQSHPDSDTCSSADNHTDSIQDICLTVPDLNEFSPGSVRPADDSIGDISICLPQVYRQSPLSSQETPIYLRCVQAEWDEQENSIIYQQAEPDIADIEQTAASTSCLEVSLNIQTPCKAEQAASAAIGMAVMDFFDGLDDYDQQAAESVQERSWDSGEQILGDNEFLASAKHELVMWEKSEGKSAADNDSSQDRETESGVDLVPIAESSRRNSETSVDAEARQIQQECEFCRTYLRTLREQASRSETHRATVSIQQTTQISSRSPLEQLWHDIGQLKQEWPQIKRKRQFSILCMADIDFEAAYLSCTRNSELDRSSALSEKRDAYLDARALDLTRSLVFHFYGLPIETSEFGRLAVLPSPVDPLPLTKPHVVEKAQTRWQKFAQKAGIRGKKKDRLVWDDNRGDWVPRISKNRTMKGEVATDWAVPAENGKPIPKDPFKAARDAKKTRAAQQVIRERANKQRALKASRKGNRS